MNIGIIYIATGSYVGFWKDFYPSCEGFFCTDAQKGYEVFTDSLKLLAMNLPNVSMHPIEDKGFITNVSSKSEFICSLATELKRKYDYLFYLNGNYKFIEPILSEEILPGADNDYLTALSFDYYKEISSDDYPYDRNPDCNACIPFGQGERYYQGGFYGGRTEEVLKLSQWCAARIKEDLDKKIVACYHDESYLNYYLVNFHPRILNDVYGKTISLDDSEGYKAILLDKEKYLGRKQLYELKGAELDNSLSFLLSNDLLIKPVGVVTFAGRLGNQMFQYAFYLYLQSKLGDGRRLYLSREGGEKIAEIFSIPASCFLPDDLSAGIVQANRWQIDSIVEKQISYMQNCTDSLLPIAKYLGYWQCYQYAEANAAKLRQQFSIQVSELNEPSTLLLHNIRHTCSVSIHVRRGDYCSPHNKMIYGGICSVRYYKDAMNCMEALLRKPLFYFIFTDDPEWTQKHLHIKNSVLVDCNRGKDDWQDMVLMAACEHHIIANSSFSWWGAWLGSSPDKIVLAPEWWYNGVITPHLLPDNWIRIPVREPDFQSIIATSLLLNSHTISNWGLQNGRMALVVFFFQYSRQYRSKFCREYAEKQLEYVCQNLGNLSSISYSDGLGGICRAIIYLIEKGFVRGNPNTLFIEVDNYLAKIVKQRKIHDLSFSKGLCGVIYYIVVRLSFLNMMKRPSVSVRNRLENIINDFLDDMMDRAKEEIPTLGELRDLLVLFHKLADLSIFHNKVIWLYAYYASQTVDNSYLLHDFDECL